MNFRNDFTFIENIFYIDGCTLDVATFRDQTYMVQWCDTTTDDRALYIAFDVPRTWLMAYKNNELTLRTLQLAAADIMTCELGVEDTAINHPSFPEQYLSSENSYYRTIPGVVVEEPAARLTLGDLRRFLEANKDLDDSMELGMLNSAEGFVEMPTLPEVKETFSTRHCTGQRKPRLIFTCGDLSNPYED